MSGNIKTHNTLDSNNWDISKQSMLSATIRLSGARITKTITVFLTISEMINRGSVLWVLIMY